MSESEPQLEQKQDPPPPVLPSETVQESRESAGPQHSADDSDDSGAIRPVWRRFSLNRSDQLFVAIFVAVSLVLMLAHWLRLSGWGLHPVEIEHLDPLENEFRIDINQASWVEWAQLEGIGPTLARRIVDDREKRGPFQSVDDVRRVSGIGAKRLEQLRPWLVIEADVDAPLRE